MTSSTHRTGRPRSADFTTPLTIPGGAVAGAEIVRELAPELALPAWQTLRSVLMWAAEEPGQRSDLFEPCAMADWERELLEGEWEPELRVPLAVLVGELSRPSQAAPDAIAHACLCVADWAFENSSVATALAFAEAAALSWPQNPRYAWTAGRLLRTHGRLREAEQWLRRAVRAATSGGDWDAQSLALNSLGNTLAQQGNYHQAAQSHRQALRSARKHNLRDREGEVLHDLFVATSHLGDLAAAEEHARDALEIYCTGHPRLPALAHDVAVLWMDRGQFSRALPVLVALLDHFTEPGERILVLSSAARAAGVCNEGELHSRFADEVSALADQDPTGQLVPRSLFWVGLGAWSLKRWSVAEQFLIRAKAAARIRGEADILMQAESAIESVRQRHITNGTPMGAELARISRETLAGRFVAKLQSGRAVAGAV